MSMWLNAWAGDHAGSVVGRQFYRALISLTVSDYDLLPSALFEKGDLDGTPWYYNIDATCLTPNAMSAIVTHIDYLDGLVYSLEMTPWIFGGEETKEPWKPGVHLFQITLSTGESDSTAIATVVVAPEIKKVINLSNAAMQVMLTTTRGRHFQRRQAR